MSQRRRLLRRAATAPEYAKTYRKLCDAFGDWLAEHGNTEVMFSFVEGAAYIGPIEALPESCLISDGARSLWQHCVARCPDATCLMFHELVERVTVAAIEAGVGISHRATPGDA